MKLAALTLSDLLDYSAERYTDYPFSSFIDTEPYTYADFTVMVGRVREFFRSKGVSKGEKVALVSENRPQWGMVYFAVATMGAVVVPVLPEFHEEEIKSIVDHSGAEGICTSSRMKDKVADLISKERWGLEIDEFIEILSGGAEGERVVAPLEKHGASRPVFFSRENDQESRVEEEDTAVIIYTSGTTGSPKGVVLNHRNLVSNVLATKEIPVKLRPGDRILSLLPLAHTYECTIGFLTPVVLGLRVFYLTKPPSPSILLPALEKVRPHIIISVPLLIEKIYRNLIAPRFRKVRLMRVLMKAAFFRKMIHRFAGGKLKKTFGGNLKYFIVGGAALAEDVEWFLREAKFPIAVGYGLTETSPLVAGSTEEYAKPYTIGPAVTGVSIRIDSPDQQQEAGEVLVKGPNVMQGYYKNEEMTAEVLTEDGWYRTGDLGTLDSDGYLSLRGRLKNMILGPSGENIYPESIEAVLNEYQFVNDAVVFEQEGRIFAKVNLDYDAMRENVQGWAESAIDTSKDIYKIAGDYLAGLRKSANKRLNAFSRLHTIYEQKEPFEKTPTRKIKRYLYTDIENKNGDKRRNTHGTEGEESGNEKD